MNRIYISIKSIQAMGTGEVSRFQTPPVPPLYSYSIISHHFQWPPQSWAHSYNRDIPYHSSPYYNKVPTIDQGLHLIQAPPNAGLPRIPKIGGAQHQMEPYTGKPKIREPNIRGAQHQGSLDTGEAHDQGELTIGVKSILGVILQGEPRDGLSLLYRSQAMY